MADKGVTVIEQGNRRRYRVRRPVKGARPRVLHVRNLHGMEGLSIGSRRWPNARPAKTDVPRDQMPFGELQDLIKGPPTQLPFQVHDATFGIG